MDIDGELRVVRDLEVKCWGAEHLLYSLILAAPSLIIWGFGIPGFALFILYRRRHKLSNLEIREKYGFLYNGYKEKMYFWEPVNMYRKIIIIMISVFLITLGVITQALILFILLILFLIVNMKLLPFAFKSLNDLEILSIVTMILTIYCGLFFLSHNTEVYNSDDAEVQEADNGCKCSDLHILTQTLIHKNLWM